MCISNRATAFQCQSHTITVERSQEYVPRCIEHLEYLEICIAPGDLEYLEHLRV
jgi:hypothetical protein